MKQPYDPVSRGPHPVGVRSGSLSDASRGGRKVELELWYPASAAVAGHDLSPQTQDRYNIFGGFTVSQEAVREAECAAGDFPLVVFSHGMAGHRRQSTFFCTQLASHGYVVVSPDHGGNTIADLLTLAMRVRAHELPDDIESLVAGYVFDRPRDVELILDACGSGALSIAGSTARRIESAKVAVSGHSFGGFTALVCAARDPRVASVIALAPAGGEGPLASPALTRELTLDFASRHVACLFLALERDTLLPLAGIEKLYRRTPAPARLFSLPDADHMHFCDRAEASHEFFRSMPKLGIFGALLGKIPPFSELAQAQWGYTFANGLGVAHLDWSMKGNQEAAAFIERAVEEMAGRGVVIRDLTV